MRLFRAGLPPPPPDSEGMLATLAWGDAVIPIMKRRERRAGIFLSLAFGWTLGGLLGTTDDIARALWSIALVINFMSWWNLYQMYRQRVCFTKSMQQIRTLRLRMLGFTPNGQGDTHE